MVRTIPISQVGGLISRANLGQAVITTPSDFPPPTAPTIPVNPWPFIVVGSVVVGGILYAIFGHKKMSWDKFFY